MRTFRFSIFTSLIFSCLLLSCTTYSGVLPKTISALPIEKYYYELLDLDFQNIDELNSMTGRSFKTFAEANDPKAGLVYNGTTFSTTVTVQQVNASGEVGKIIPVNAQASADFKSVTINFEYIRYSAIELPSKQKSVLLKSHPDASDVALLIGGHISFECVINTSNLKMSGSYLGAISAALAAGAVTASINGHSYGIVGQDISRLIGIATGNNQDSLTQVGTILQAISSLTNGVQVNVTKVAYRFTPKDPMNTIPAATRLMSTRLESESEFINKAFTQ